MANERGWRERRIRSSEEIKRLAKIGRRIQTPLYQLIYSKTEQDAGRFGVIVGKKLGRAALRNRIKRRFREILRKEPLILKASLNLLVIPKKPSLDESAENLRKAIQKTLNEITP